jgi:hypothetical protein
MHLNVISRDAINNYNYGKGRAHWCVIYFLSSVIRRNVQANQERMELQGTHNHLVYTIVNLLDKNMHRGGGIRH